MRNLLTGSLALGLLVLGTAPSLAVNLQELIRAGYEIRAAVPINNESLVYVQKGTSAFACTWATCTKIN